MPSSFPSRRTRRSEELRWPFSSQIQEICRMDPSEIDHLEEFPESEIPEPVEEPPQQPAAILVNRYTGIASAPFSKESSDILLGQIPADDIEIRPDGLIYLPEIKYRRILNRAFGPGAWSLLPMEIRVAADDNMLYYKGALFVLGRFVSEAIGEQQYF